MSLPICRIGIAYQECPTLAKDAVTFTIVQQNRLQESFDFAVIDLEDRPYELRPVEMVEYHRASSELLETRNLRSLCDKWLVITERPFSSNYYLYGDYQGVVVLSLANWNRWMAPPSVVEFILSMTQRACIDALVIIESHRMTKGCLHDFNANLRHTRFMVLTSALCPECRAHIQHKHGYYVLRDLLTLMDRKWLGSFDDSKSVVSLLKKAYHNDLFISRGLSPTFWENLWGAMSPGLLDTLWKLALALSLAWIAFHFNVPTLKSPG